MEDQRRPKKVEEIPDQHLRASALVGRIVEKGFSSSPSKKPTVVSSFPQPTVLPFPVARHRSHGPHWAPVPTETEEDEVEEDRDETNYYPIASFARPVPKKEKKGLDFSKWRVLVPEEPSSAAPSRVKKRTNSSPLKSVEKKSQAKYEGKISAEAAPAAALLLAEAVEKSLGSKKMPVGNGEIVADKEANGKFNTTSVVEMTEGEVSSSDSSHSIVHANGNDKAKSFACSKLDQPTSSSLVDDIDAENRARLGRMPPEEIAEAQAEIMAKMDPAVLEILKKRGRDKLGGKKSTSKSDGDKGNAVTKNATHVKGRKSSVTEGSAPVGGKLQPSGVHDSEAWKAWSERVEKVREMRFSLDGNVVRDECSQYTTENVTERDFLRTEGDPGAAGYTLKEAVTLIRSMVPGQRTFALQLLASVLDRALNNLLRQDTRSNMKSTNSAYNCVDWQAIWAYALGPEPEIALSLRIALDDNHNSVVLASAKVIECILSCDLNENYFNISEKSSIHEKDICTAPVFRVRPEVVNGFLRGGFWKYNTKPSNILPSQENNDEEEEEEETKHTIQDDVVVAGQDIVSGLVRMGILPRICYLLEMEPLPSLEESLVSILTGIARHSPTCAAAVMKCPRLVKTVVSQFTKLTSVETRPYHIKSVKLLKVLSEAGRQNCLDFVNCGFFRQTTWQLYKPTVSLDYWIKSGRENCKLTSALIVQQLRFWKICIRYGCCIAYFEDFFPALCFWLSPPTLDKLIENNVLGEFASVTSEAYLVMEALSQRLPRLHSAEQLNMQVKEPSDDSLETWSWSHVIPMVELAMKWLSLKGNPSLSSVNKWVCKQVEDSSLRHILWVISAVMQMLSTIFDRIAPENSNDGSNFLPWLPCFVPKVGLEIVKNGFLDFLDSSGRRHEGSSAGGCSFAGGLCHLRHQNDIETSLSSTSCLHGLVRLTISIDKSVQRAKGSKSNQTPEGYVSSLEDMILEDGIAKWAKSDLARVLSVFLDLTASGWQNVQCIEIFGRGGPAPGVGVGWGSSGGGFWSTTVLLAQAVAQLIQSLYEIFPIVPDKDLTGIVATEQVIDHPFDTAFPILQKVNSVIGICLVAGPEDKYTLEKAFDMLFQASVMKSIDTFIDRFRILKGHKPFEWRFTEEDYLVFSKVLNSHFRNRWLNVKRKSPEKVEKSNPNDKTSKKKDALETIFEDSEASEMTNKHQDYTSLQTEWARQRLPLPEHWFLSPISTVGDCEALYTLSGSSKVENKSITLFSDISDVVRSGLFFLLGLETMSQFLYTKAVDSPITRVPLVWKLHGLSMALLVKMDVLEDKIREIFETLQTVYGEYLNQSRNGNTKAYQKENEKLSSSETTFVQGVQKISNEDLDFQKHVHESYNTFVETFVEQFVSMSYGDVIYGRQVAVYLHRSVGVSVRLAAWCALSNAQVFELLPPLGKCIAEAEGYLEPIEDNEGILEAYVKSWTSGALDRASTRGSMSFTLALHHLSGFIFHCDAPDKSSLRNKLSKSLLRGNARKHNQEVMLLSLINYKWPRPQEHDVREGSALDRSETERRFMVLSEACKGNSSLLAEVEKLKSSN